MAICYGRIFIALPVLGIILLQHLVKLADSRQEHNQEDVLEAVDPLLSFCPLTPDINLLFVTQSINSFRTCKVISSHHYELSAVFVCEVILDHPRCSDSDLKDVPRLREKSWVCDSLDVREKVSRK